MSESNHDWKNKLARILCWIGIHDFRVINVTFGFSAGDQVEKVECRRCGFKTTRHGSDN